MSTMQVLFKSFIYIPGLSCSCCCCCTPRCSSVGSLSPLAWASVKTSAASVHFCSSVLIDHSQITDSQFVSIFLSWRRFSRNFHDLIFLSLALERLRLISLSCEFPCMSRSYCPLPHSYGWSWRVPVFRGEFSRVVCVCEVSFGSLAVGVPLDYRVCVFEPNLNLRLILNLSTNTINTKFIY